MMAKALEGKTALVTGGSRGIGRATALALAEAGANVAINYQRCREAAEEVCGKARDMTVKAHVYQADVSRERDTQEMVDAVVKDFGRPQILVNNAGITNHKSFIKMTREM